MKLYALAVILAAGLSGCAQLHTAVTLSTLSVTPQQIYVAGNLFVGLEKTATNYLKLPACPATPVCRDPVTVKKVDAAIRTAAPAVTQLVSYAKSPSGPVPISAYNVVVTATQTLQTLLGGK